MKVTDEELQEICGQMEIYKVREIGSITESIFKLNEESNTEKKFCYYKKDDYFYLMEANSISEDYKNRYIKNKRKLYCGLCHQEVIHTVPYFRARDTERESFVSATFKHLRDSEKCDWYHSVSDEEENRYSKYDKYKGGERESNEHLKAKDNIKNQVGSKINIPMSYSNEDGIYEYKEYKVIEVKTEYTRMCKNSLRRRIVSDALLVCKAQDDDIKLIDIEIFHSSYKDRSAYIRRAEETEIYASLEIQATVINENYSDYLTNTNFYIYIKRFENENRAEFLERTAKLLNLVAVENIKLKDEIEIKNKALYEEQMRITNEKKAVAKIKAELEFKEKSQKEFELRKQVYDGLKNRAKNQNLNNNNTRELTTYTKYYINQIVGAVTGARVPKNNLVKFITQFANSQEYQLVSDIFEYFYIKSFYTGFSKYSKAKEVYIEVMTKSGQSIKEFKKENVIKFKCPCCKSALERGRDSWGQEVVRCSKNAVCTFSFKC